MKVFKYGIMLERLKAEDIELVREWRNSDPVRLNMEYREIITAGQQKKWFASINNQHNNYLLIHYKGEKIGLLNDKNIIWESRTSESGLFLGKTEYYNTFVPYFISVAGIELNFYFLLWGRQYAHILKTNTNAVKYNMQLGYRLTEGQENTENQLYELTREDFERRAGKIRQAVRTLATVDLQPRLLLEPDDYACGIAQSFETILLSRNDIAVHETTEGKWFTLKDPAS